MAVASDRQRNLGQRARLQIRQEQRDGVGRGRVPVLVLGVMESDRVEDKVNPGMMRDLFRFSSKNEYQIQRPDEPARSAFFESLRKRFLWKKSLRER